MKTGIHRHDEPQLPEPEARIKKTVKVLYKALARGNKEVAARLLASDLEWWYHGPPGCQHMMRTLTGKSKHTEFKFKPRSIASVGDLVIVEGWEGLAAYWVHVWILKDGIITQFREYFNTAITVLGESEVGNKKLWQSEPLEGSNCSLPDLMPKKPNPSPIPKAKPKTDEISAAADESSADLLDDDVRVRRLAEDENDKSLDVGPNGRPLFTSTASLSQLTRKDTCTYMKFSMEDLNAVLPEGLPLGMVKEFEESKRSALLVRQNFLDLRDNFRRIVDPPLQSSDGKGPKVRKQIVLDGPVSCGKSIALAMLVHWARDEDHGLSADEEVVISSNPVDIFFFSKLFGFFSLLPSSSSIFCTLPVKMMILVEGKDFLKYNESRLQQLPCQVFDPIPLGEGVGVGWMKGVDSMAMPQGSTLYDLVQTGLTYTHAAVGVVVRLRKELSLVKDIPVLIAIDQYNNWFTFSEYEEPVTVRSCRPIHARELATVKAFRSMMHKDMMVGAFSHSTAVGKLRKDLPDVPVDARINFPRYSLDEAASVCHYYLRQRLVRREAFSEESWKKIYFLSHGNGAEMRWLAPFMR
ncbi:hypothetical protein F0562_021567 [Nyssa sinensis]|uniref:Small ribosomal subunit protein mS29 n=1 Tax=Nyssa sinensis TaxID=561372 RepID=A0A5J5BPH1_9ASTE|nr:hypothetical protein F0562_021567 [Nyssa sinensis]